MSEIEKNDEQTSSLENMLRVQAESTVCNIKKQMKKQFLVSGLLCAEGVIALIGGILLLVLADITALGWTLIALGTFVAVAVAVMNVFTMKKLRTVLNRAQSFLPDKTDQINPSH